MKPKVTYHRLKTATDKFPPFFPYTYRITATPTGRWRVVTDGTYTTLFVEVLTKIPRTIRKPRKVLGLFTYYKEQEEEVEDTMWLPDDKLYYEIEYPINECSHGE